MEPWPRPRAAAAGFARLARRGVGMLICLVGAAVLVAAALEHASPHMRAALLAGGTAAAATALGTLPVLLSQQFSKRTYNAYLGFGAGVMLGATSFSLVVPALAAARAAGAGALGASALVGAGLLAGAGFILFLGRVAGTEGILTGGVASGGQSLRRAWLFVWAVTLHNIPEGLAIGVAYAGIDPDKAASLAAGISIQDVPEGLVVAFALRTVGYGKLFATALGVVSGLVEPVAAGLGVAVIDVAAWLLPSALAAAGGAMLFVIVNEVIPEAQANGNGQPASVALVGGFVLMTLLDTAWS